MVGVVNANPATASGKEIITESPHSAGFDATKPWMRGETRRDENIVLETSALVGILTGPEFDFLFVMDILSIPEQ